MAHKITWTEQQWGDVSITEAQLDRLIVTRRNT